MAKELFLTSSIHAVAHDVANRMEHIGTLAFITTAVETKIESSDLAWLKRDREALISQGFKVTDYTLSGKTSETILLDLSTFDAIYLSGGDTTHLAKTAQATGAIEIIRSLIETEGKTLITTSAGSIFTGPEIPPYYDANPDASLNLVNFTMVPHWGSEHFKEKWLDSRLHAAYDSYDKPLLTLNDSQYVHVKDDRIEIIDVSIQ